MVDQAAVKELSTADGTAYVFRHVPLVFGTKAVADAFALKNNKSLGETLAHHRYKSLAIEAANFRDSMTTPLGQFLLSLKLSGDPFYKRFLNKNGDQAYTVFAINDPAVVGKKGVYAYFVDDHLRYIGRCRDTMRKRINHGYGKIHPKNCFIDGQSTNCHLNAKIAEVQDLVRLWFCQLENDNEIMLAEAELIRAHQPSWNIHRF